MKTKYINRNKIVERKFKRTIQKTELKNELIPIKKRKVPLWLIASILYGFSWCRYTDVNLSFLAWFAFVPLFIDLENRNTFWSFYKRASLFSVVAYLMIGWGSLIIAKDQWLMLFAGLDELFMPTVSFAVLYPFKKKFSFENSLKLFPFIISLWEWIYQKLEFTFSYPMLSHSQTQNTIFIQYIDLFGEWSIAFWVMLFNVLLFFLYKKGQIFNQKRNWKWVAVGLLKISALMLLPPLIYYGIRYNQINNKIKDKLNITLTNTSFSVFDNTPERAVKKIERLTFITDSVDYELKQKNIRSDLYVWHEGAIDYGNNSIILNFIYSAVNDWKIPLLTGMQVIPDTTNKKDLRAVNRNALFVPESKGNPNPSGFCAEGQYYDKLRLTPGHEVVPYHKFLAMLPFFSIALNDVRFLKHSSSIKLINLTTQDGKKVELGTPTCLEQNYPNIWADMSKKGAQCFVQLSFETWWPIKYFLNQIDDFTRLRSIENRRAVARCSNGGLTGFIDPLGNIYSSAKDSEASTTASVVLYDDVTFFSKHQNLFPLLSLIMIILFVSYWKIKSSKSR